ncbi:MAG TPA: hydrogenase maturation protease [bacterium]|nr:hydrogenase maturation protease [bacterium]HQJ65869.1 hydrogenase maturation protease [bacterium]
MKPLRHNRDALRALRNLIFEAGDGPMVVLGIGNPHYGDDALGCETARLLQVLGAPYALICNEMPENYTLEVKACYPGRILLVDAVDFFAPPGDLIYLRRQELRSDRFNTHKPDLGLLMRYLESETGAKTALIGIQPKNRALHAPISPEVHESLSHLAALLATAARLANSAESQAAGAAAALDGNPLAAPSEKEKA